MTDVKLLPLPEMDLFDTAMTAEGPVRVPVGHSDKQSRDYARANVSHATAPLHAEIERLQGEVTYLWGMAEHHESARIAAESQRDRLAEALRIARPYVEWCDPHGRDPEDYPEATEVVREHQSTIDEALASASQLAKELGEPHHSRARTLDRSAKVDPPAKSR